MRWAAAALTGVALCSGVGARGANAQTAERLGSVAVADATVGGAQATLVDATGGRWPIDAGSTVIAKPDRNAAISLTHGGSVLVCQTTSIRLSGTDDALALSLDRGAIEIHTRSDKNGVIQTPDIRVTVAGDGPLDLRMRVVFNGDTCVENRGHRAPQLNVTDAFGETSYLLKPGQHVMFEHGDLKTVMDRETTPCGCPPGPKQPKELTIADAALTNASTQPKKAAAAAAANPFPEAASDGLAAPADGQPEKVGERHVQVATTLTYDPSAADRPAQSGAPAAASPEPPTALQAAVPAPAPAPPQPEKRGPLHAIGHFFKKLFVR